MKSHFTQLFALLLSQGFVEKLSDAVSRAELQMKAAGELDLWRFWKGQALLAMGQTREAAEYVKQIECREQSEVLERLIQADLNIRTNNHESEIDRMERRYAESSDPLHLFELCQAYYNAENWTAVAAHAKQVLEGVGTAAALLMAVESAQRVNDFQLCLELLENRDVLFPNCRFPADLRRLRLLCWRKEGRLEHAIPEAAAIARETGESSDFLTLVYVRLEGADPRGAVIDARELLNRSDIAPEDHLRLARVFKVEDHSAAIAHLEKALASGDRSPGFLAGAVDLVFSLNCEEKFADLRPALEGSASTGGAIQLAGPERLIEMMRESAERQHEANTLYIKGLTPLHLALELIGGSLGQAYEQRFNPGVKVVQWPLEPPLFIHHGARTFAGPLGIKKLHVDISALLIADKLELLDLVEDVFAPIYLPPSVIPALYKEIGDAQSSQPSKLEESRAILSLISSQKIRIRRDNSLIPEVEEGRPTPDWLGRLKLAQESKGFVVDFLPISTGFPPSAVKLTEDERDSVIDCAGVISALNTNGKLTATEYAAAVRSLGGNASNVAACEVSLGVTLYLVGNIVEVLAGTGLLGKICECFTVYADSYEVERQEARVEQEARSSQFRGRLSGLVNRIQRGLGTTWRHLPALRSENEENLGYESRCLSELIVNERTPDTFVWIDDRFLNGFEFCGGNPIVSIYEVLSELRTLKRIGDGEYVDKIYRLRKANLRHIPLTSDEIMAVLLAARFSVDDIVETPELKVLRQYIAACLSERGSLQLPPLSEDVPNPKGELAFPLSVHSAIREALLKLWAQVNTDNIVELTARADWLLKNLWFEMESLSFLLKDNGLHDDLLSPFLGSGLAQLYCQGLGLEGERQHADKPGQPPRLLYFRWLVARFGNDVETVEATARHLAKMFEHGLELNLSSKEKQHVARALFSDLLKDLPDFLRVSPSFSKEIRDQLGIRQYEAMSIGDFSFDVKAFWSAAKCAVNAGGGSLISRKNPKAFTLRFAVEDGDAVIYLSGDAPEDSFVLSDAAYLALDEREQVRRTVLRSHPEWFDCGEMIFHQNVDSIAATENELERMRQIEQWRRGSASYQYSLLAQKLKAGQALNLSHFEPPTGQGLLNHIRIESPPLDGELPRLLEAAVIALLDEVGFDETFRRVSILPVRLPQSIQNAYDALPFDRQASWRSEMIQVIVSPVARLQLIRLISRTDQAAACDMLEALFEKDGLASCAAFKVLLAWTLGRLECRKECSALPASALLAASWLHAGRLFELLAATDSLENIQQFFTDAAKPSMSDLFKAQPESFKDVCHPSGLSLRCLVLHYVASEFDRDIAGVAHIERLQSFLRNLCFINPGNPSIPHRDLITPASWKTNILGSFICGDRGSLMESWIGVDSKCLSTEWIVQLAQASINALRTSLIDTSMYWYMLSDIFTMSLPPGMFNEPLLNLLREQNIGELALLDSNSRRVATLFLIQQMAPSPEAVKPLRKQLVDFAKQFGEGTKSDSTLGQNADFLVECAHFLSIFQGGSVHSPSEFVSIMLELIHAWPRMVDEFQLTLLVALNRLPPSTLVFMSPLIFEIRKLAR